MSTAPALTSSQAFEADFRGEVLRPEHPGYDTARLVFNAMYDRRPALIARCTGVADVAAAVNFARSEGLQIAVRGGGHSVQGYSSCDDGIVIDLSPMKGLRVDPVARTAHAQAGLTWGEFDRETQAFGLATTGGRVSTTGIAGLTLGSGSGWLERSLGLSCDNLLSADLVTADGRVVTASEMENAELFWGLRGGGGNFGIVTSFEFRLHEVGPVVYGGMLIYPRERGPEVLSLYRELMAAAPDEFGSALALLTAPAEPFLPPDIQLAPAVGVVVCHAGDHALGEELCRPLRELAPVLDLAGPMPYLAVQQLLDASGSFGLNHYWKADTLDQLTEGAIEAILAGAERMPAPLSMLVLEPGGRAIARVPDEDAPISGRDADYRWYAVAVWDEPASADEHLAWARGVAEALRPFSTGSIQLNFPSEHGERVRSTFGPAKYERLVALKDRYDPDNAFSLNANIKPS